MSISWKPETDSSGLERGQTITRVRYRFTTKSFLVTTAIGLVWVTGVMLSDGIPFTVALAIASGRMTVAAVACWYAQARGQDEVITYVMGIIFPPWFILLFVWLRYRWRRWRQA